MAIQAVVWDLDGTLLNTLDDLTTGVNGAMRLNGFPEHTRDEVRQMVGNGIRNLMIRAVPGGEGNPRFQSAYGDFVREYAAHDKDTTRPYDGIQEALDRLSKSGIRHAVVSNKIDFAVRELCQEYFGDRIAVSVGDDPSRRKKPAPDSVFTALSTMRVPLENAVYIGDSNVDIETAKNAGIPGIGVLWGFRDRENLEQAGARWIVSSPVELADLILSF